MRVKISQIMKKILQDDKAGMVLGNNLANYGTDSVKLEGIEYRLKRVHKKQA